MKIITMTNVRLGRLARNLVASLERLGIPIEVTRLDARGGKYGTGSFARLMMRKLQLTQQVLRAGDYVLWTDVDVVFRQDPREDLMERLQECDVVFQQDAGHGGICAGFYAAKPTAAAIDLFDINKLPELDGYADDQRRLTHRMRQDPDVAVVKRLPSDLYPSGWYQKRGLMSDARFVTHYNWDKSTKKKIRRMEKCGDWLLGH
jgi:hypothetical protein